MLTDFIIKLLSVFLDFYTNTIHPMIFKSAKNNLITSIIPNVVIMNIHNDLPSMKYTPPRYVVNVLV